MRLIVIQFFGEIFAPIQFFVSNGSASSSCNILSNTMLAPAAVRSDFARMPVFTATVNTPAATVPPYP